MTDPTTSNILLAVPTRGSDPGTWDVPVNNNSSAIDGYFGGVQIVSTSNAPITLTAPSGTVTAGGGPTQAQNGVLVFTGTLTADVTVTLPLPGYYIVNNQTSTSTNKLLFFRAVGTGNVIAMAFGETIHIFNDGTNVSFANLARVGAVEIWAGLSAMPRWVTACTIPPYLLNDGSVYNFSTYPALGRQLLGVFGGNGITTFGVPDHRGRVPLPYDGTGTRITTSGCGLNGQTLGASLDLQAETLLLAQLPTGITVTGTVTIYPNGNSGDYTPYVPSNTVGNANIQNTIGSLSVPYTTSGSWAGANSFSGSNTLTSNNTSGNAHPNVQPSQVTGISVTRAA